MGEGAGPPEDRPVAPRPALSRCGPRQCRAEREKERAVPTESKTVPERIVEVLYKLAGSHPGFRPVHAKGLVCLGTFRASAAGARYTSEDRSWASVSFCHCAWRSRIIGMSSLRSFCTSPSTCVKKIRKRRFSGAAAFPSPGSSPADSRDSSLLLLRTSANGVLGRVWTSPRAPAPPVSGAPPTFMWPSSFAERQRSRFPPAPALLFAPRARGIDAPVAPDAFRAPRRPAIGTPAFPRR